MPVARGVVLLTQEMAPFDGAVVRVRLLDVTQVDAPARLLAEDAIADVHHPAGAETPVSFELRGEPVPGGTDVIVDVHVDLSGDGRVAVGDYVTTVSHPVRAEGETSGLVIRPNPVT